MAAALLAVALTVPVPGAGAQTGDEAAEATVAALSTEDLETIARLETYLNRITTLRARFVQVSSNGAVAEGDLYLSRPGRLRFEYDPPHPALLIANGVNLLYYDRDLEQASFLPLWETPLSFLLRERVDLSEGGIEVLAVERGLARKPGARASCRCSSPSSPSRSRPGRSSTPRESPPRWPCWTPRSAPRSTARSSSMAT
jgi:hypothetical protein